MPRGGGSGNAVGDHRRRPDQDVLLEEVLAKQHEARLFQAVPCAGAVEDRPKIVLRAVQQDTGAFSLARAGRGTGDLVKGSLGLAVLSAQLQSYSPRVFGQGPQGLAGVPALHVPRLFRGRGGIPLDQSVQQRPDIPGLLGSGVGQAVNFGDGEQPPPAFLASHPGRADFPEPFLHLVRLRVDHRRQVGMELRILDLALVQRLAGAGELLVNPDAPFGPLRGP